jgi:vitamin B12 transporter
VRPDPLDYALSASHGRSDGFNARPVATANPDIDGWRRRTVQGRAGWQITPGQRLEGGVLSTRLTGQYDGGRTTDDVSDYALRTATLGWSSHWAAGSDTRVTVGQSRSTYETQPSYYRSETTLRNFLLRHEELVAGQHFSVSLERRDDHLLNPATAFAATLEGERTQDAVALWAGAPISARTACRPTCVMTMTVSLAAKGTGSLAWGWNFAPGFRVTGFCGDFIPSAHALPALQRIRHGHTAARSGPQCGSRPALGRKAAMN